ncbi:type VI secretion system Vgr family protein [Pedobacter nototheniae]|uniref:type VI secretion system Vgr family protein n=1 Tax=Pedobacter nototheniae TaxID=2488994 RepID=UPI00292E5AEF|nr:phage baseplate assembly protein V [Pedobacter nototheniae]
MELKLITDINIENKTIKHFSSLSLKQTFNDHHYFELRFNHDQMGSPGLITLDESRDFVGKTFSASFGHANDKLQNFVGIVTKVELSQQHGYHGVLVVSGYSPTILIDRGADLGSYLDKTLDDIVKLACKDTAENDLTIVSKASRTSPIDYVIQYRESDFEFLNRLSGEYFEWFYYDGTQLRFGKPDDQKEVSLFYGRDVNNLQYAMEVAPIKNKRFSYNPKGDEMLLSQSNGKTSGSQDLTHVVQASNQVYSKTFNQPSSIRLDNSNDIKSYVDNEEKANISELLKIKATGDNATLSIGSIAEISMSLRKEAAFNTQSLGKFLITNIHHEIDGLGRYHNSFEGLVSTTERLLVKNYKKPSPEMQLADVVDHQDPDQQGRIKVKFKWECMTNDVTEWLRVVTPNAGIGDRGSNRGFFAVPEIGDQVVIGFEEGNVARPVVMGSVYNSSNVDSSPQIKNHLKSLTTRSGHLIEFDDDPGSQGIKITDINSNIIHIDTKGNNITITALENMTLNCKNMQINVTENMGVQVGKDQSVNVGTNQTVSVGKDIATTAGNNYSLAATGNIEENSDNRTEIVSKDFLRQSETSNELASEISVFSQKENMTLQSGKIVEVNSAEKSKMF